MGIRIIVMIDTDHDDAAEAYLEVYETMQQTSLEWESTDEWFADDGAEFSGPEIVAARRKVFAGTHNRPDLTCEHQPEVTGT